jgi:Na+/proline symporter
MILIAGNLAGAGMILQFTLDIPAVLGLSIVGIVVMVYTMAGGLFAVTWNDVLQFGIALIGFSASLVYILSTTETDVVQAAMSSALRADVFTSFEAGALSTWASLLALALGDIVAIDFMERVFASRTARYAKISCLLAGGMTIVVGLGLAFLGVIASSLMGQTGGENVFFAFLEQYLPSGLRMMMFMALLAACISTIDGAILACSVVISKNIVQQNFPKCIPPSRLLVFSRLMAIPVTAGAMVIAIIRPVPGDLLILAFDVVFAGCFVPLALGVYWKKSSARAAFWAMIIPSTLRILIHPILEHIPGAASYTGLETLIPPLLSLILFVALSLQDHSRNTKGVSYA